MVTHFMRNGLFTPLITTHKDSCGKVMCLSHVCLFMGVCVGGGGVSFPAHITSHMTQGREVCIWGRGGKLHRGGGLSRHPPPPSTDTWDTTGYVNKRVVRILLECSLCCICDCNKGAIDTEAMSLFPYFL